MILPSFRVGLLWLALPVMIAVGAGVGYLASEAWSTGDAPVAATAQGHTHDHGAMPGDEGTTTGGGHAGHDMGAMPSAGAGSAVGGHAGHDMGAMPSAGAGSAVGGHAGHDAGSPAPTHGGHNHTGSVAAPATRPRTAVLATFAAVNLGILAAAAVLRHRAPGRRGRRGAPPASSTAVA